MAIQEPLMQPPPGTVFSDEPRRCNIKEQAEKKMVILAHAVIKGIGMKY